jgi:hypothetical protein
MIVKASGTYQSEKILYKMQIAASGATPRGDMWRYIKLTFWQYSLRTRSCVITAVASSRSCRIS